MKNIKSLILIAAWASLLFSSCVKETNEYKPAPAPTTVEAYFSQEAPASYSLEKDKNSFSVTVNRVKAEKDIEVVVDANVPEEFDAPVFVKFKAGEKEAAYVISYDPSKIVEGKAYSFNLTIRSELSEYAEKAYSFKATLPPSEIWEPIKTQACFKESIMCVYTGGDTQVFDCYVEKLKDKEIYRIVNPMSVKVVGGKKYHNPYYDETGTASGIWPKEFLDENDYYLVFDLEGDKYKAAFGEDAPAMPENGVFIADQGLHFAWDKGEFKVYSCLYLSQAFRDYYGLTFADGFGKYDPKKKSMTMGNFILGAGNTVFGWPGYAGTPEPVLYLDKTLMVDDYNDDTWFGKSSALYEGYASSKVLSSDGKTAFEFSASMRYDASYLDKCEKDKTTGEPIVPEGTTTTYYIADYFGEGHCVAFTAPAFQLLEDGSKISDMGNEQSTGLNLLGNDIYFKVKKGTFNFAKDEEFPTVTFVLNVYGKDADGNVVVKYGNFEETYTAEEYGKDCYTLDDIVGSSKSYLYGEWAITSTEDGKEYTYLATISDGGVVDNVSLVKIEGLSGYSFDDTFYAEYDTDYGILWVSSGPTGTNFNYQGTDYPISLVLWDPDTDKVYSSGVTMVAGICADDNIAFVNCYTDINLSGLGWKISLGGLCYISNIYGSWVGYGNTSLSSPRNFYKENIDAKLDYISLNSVSSSKIGGSCIKGMKKVSAKVPYKLENNKAERSINPCLMGGSFDSVDKNAPVSVIKF